MYVSDSLGLNSLCLTVSYIGLAGALVSDADIIDATLEQVSTILTSNGFENVTVERGTTTFLGEEVACMIAHATIQGIDMYEKQVEIIKDGYMASFTATTFMEDGTDAFLGMISSLN